MRSVWNDGAVLGLLTPVSRTRILELGILPVQYLVLTVVIWSWFVFDSLQCLHFSLPQWRLTLPPANKGNIPPLSLPASPDTSNIANCKQTSVCPSHHTRQTRRDFYPILPVRTLRGVSFISFTMWARSRYTAGPPRPRCTLRKFQLDGMKVFQCSKKLWYNSLNLL